MFADALFRVPSLHLADAHSAGGGTAHLYELRRPAPALGGELGSAHGLDVQLLFGNFTGPAARLFFGEAPPPAEALALADGIRCSWASFAAHGDPGRPAYRVTDGRLTRLLDAERSTAAYPEDATRRIWEGHGAEPFDLL
ncbi:hypothetical protein AB0F13_18065 [Streptomyces sp. NPDC026206]|uniref:hypothetical protein n=1 Tax=Streptomyces sp. NPDC026206 TaxID=3157089 RepID=UPI0033EE462D